MAKASSRSFPGKSAGLSRRTSWSKLKHMSRQTSQLLEAFEALPSEEQRAFTIEFLRRVIPFDSGPLDDDETAFAADEIFSMIDTEEHEARSR